MSISSSLYAGGPELNLATHLILQVQTFGTGARKRALEAMKFCIWLDLVVQQLLISNEPDETATL